MRDYAPPVNSSEFLVIFTTYGILESICLVNLPKGLCMRLLQVRWTIVIAYYMVFPRIRLGNSPPPHQLLMNASARLVYCAPKYCHITPLLTLGASLVTSARAH